MTITERLNALRDTYQRTHRHHGHNYRCDCCEALEEHLDTIQTELEQLLARVPAPTDTTPAHIGLTAT